MKEDSFIPWNCIRVTFCKIYDFTFSLYLIKITDILFIYRSVRETCYAISTSKQSRKILQIAYTIGFPTIAMIFLKRKFIRRLNEHRFNVNDIMVIFSIIDFVSLHDPVCDRDFTFPFLR